MARKNGPTPEDLEFSSEYESTRSVPEFYPGRGFDDGEAMDRARFVDDDSDQESPFLRAQKRVPVRRGPIPKKTANTLKIILLWSFGIMCVGVAVFAVYRYLTTSWRFRLQSYDSIQVSGNDNVTRDEVLSIFKDDITKNIFGVPLDERKRMLETIPWVESATVMRCLPNKLAATVKERTPVAFVQVGSRIALIDASGVIMEPGATRYSFPVLTGFSDVEPLSTRVPRVNVFSTLMKDLDSDGRNYSQDVSDIDLTNPEDIQVTLSQGNVLLHMAPHRFLEQYEKYLAVVAQCREKIGSGKLDVDTRIFGQVPCKPIIDPQAAAQKVAAEQQTSQTNSKPVAAKADKKPRVAAPKHRTKKH